MPSPLASIYSTADSFKRSLLDMLSNPVESAQQIVGNANDRAGVLNELTSKVSGQTLDSLKSGGPVMPDTPENRQLVQMMADAYNPAGMFIGPASNLWNKNMAFEAQKMLNRGVSPREVWQKTGTGRYSDGQFRQEISDVGSALKTRDEMLSEAEAIKEQIAQRKTQIAESKMYPDLFPKELKAAQSGLRQQNKEAKGLIDSLSEDPKWRGNPASASVSHDRLFEAYPELKDQLVKQNVSRDPGLLGYQNTDEIGITSEGMLRDPRSTLLHEFQHGVQDIEDFGRGGSMRTAFEAQRAAEDKIGQINQQLKMVSNEIDLAGSNQEARKEAYKRYTDLLDERQKLVPLMLMNPAKGYHTLAGEAEARLTQTRRDLTDEQRRQYFPFELQDAQENPFGLDVPPDMLWNIDGQGIVDMLR